MRIRYYTTCNSQYFAGHHLPIVQVLVDGKTTTEELKKGLLSHEVTCHLEYTFTEEMFDQYNAAVEEMFGELCPDTLKAKWDSTLGIPQENDEWDCYAYFIIEVDEDAC